MAGSLYSVVWQRALFSRHECSQLVAAASDWTPALVTADDGSSPATNGRKHGSWALVPLSPAHEWIYARLACFLSERASFGFELEEIGSPLKIQRYQVGDFHGWHADLGAVDGQNRKVGISVQLSASRNYEGGDLRFFDPPQHRAGPRERGCAIGFPSYLPHEVTPVTAGTRLALTGWVTGPRFR